MTSGPSDMELERLLESVGTDEPRTMLVGYNRTGKSVAMRALARAFAEAADASGATRHEIRTYFVNACLYSVDSEALARSREEACCLRDSDWDVDWSGFGSADLSLEWLVADVCGSRTVRSAEAFSIANAWVELWRSTGWVEFIDPVNALLLFLQRLIRLGRRADASRQLAVQRLRFACRAARSSPDVPPGEVVVSSSRVPRGPDLPRVVSTVVDHSRVSGPT